MILGYSTGSLARGNFKEALRMIDHAPGIQAVELSALRENELSPLINELS